MARLFLSSFLGLLCAFFSFSSPFSDRLSAQTPPDLNIDRAVDLLNKNSIENDLRLPESSGDLTIEGQKGDEGALSFDEAEQSTADYEGDSFCFQVKAITFSGYEPIGIAPEGYESMLNTCIGAPQLAKLINSVETFYLRKGFLGTRTFFPVQSIADGSLELKIIPGIVQRLEYSDGKADDGRLAWAFPLKAGDLVELKKLKKGLESFDRVRSEKVRFFLMQGDEPGKIIIRVSVEKLSSPYFLRTSLSNSGNSLTGKIVSNSSLEIENITNHNDNLTLSYGLSLRPGFYDERGRQNYGLNYELPVEDDLYRAYFDYTNYDSLLEGASRTFSIGGYLLTLGIATDSLLSNKDDTKIWGSLTLERKRQRHRILDVNILSQQSDLALLGLGLKSQSLWDGASLNARALLKTNLRLPGTEDPFVSGIDKSFQIFEGGFAYRRELITGKALFESLWSGQFSKNSLPASEKISLGGRSTIRGFHEKNLTGNSGFYSRNTLTSRLLDGEYGKLDAHLGFDFGALLFHDWEELNESTLSGLSIGLSWYAPSQLTLKATLSHPLTAPERLGTKDWDLFMSLSKSF